MLHPSCPRVGLRGSLLLTPVRRRSGDGDGVPSRHTTRAGAPSHVKSPIHPPPHRSAPMLLLAYLFVLSLGFPHTSQNAHMGTTRERKERSGRDGLRMRTSSALPSRTTHSCSLPTSPPPFPLSDPSKYTRPSPIRLPREVGYMAYLFV